MSAETVPPLRDEDWPPDLADMLQGFAGGLNVYRVMAHHPALLRAWAALRAHIVTDSALAPDALEVVILRSGHRLRSGYEWSQHIERARKIGMPDARILSLRGPAAAMAPGDAALCRAVDALFDTARIPEPLLGDLMQTLGKQAVFDLMATVGFYATLGFILNTFQTPLDEGIRASLAANPLDSASD